MTIPTLIKETRDREVVSRLKKTYSVLSSAYTQAVQAEGGTPETWGLTNNATGYELFINKIKPYLNVLIDCSADAAAGCFKDGETYKNLNNTNLGTFYNRNGSLLLADGASLNAYSFSWPACDSGAVYGTSLALQNACGFLIVDANGFKKPNTLGKDTFWFWITRYGIVPAGTPAEAILYTFSGRCLKGDGTYDLGNGCTAWVLKNDNLDYLKCPQTIKAGWDGPNSCN